jgi:Leucine-rich repeat (LRR) protein
LIVFVIVVGAGLGWIVRQAQIQRDAVAAIRKAGGTVFYSYEIKDGNSHPGARPWAPSWLVELTGVDFFGHVTGFTLIGFLRPADTTLAEVGRLTQLERLSLDNASATDVGLVHLKGLTNLSVLDLRGTQVTDGGLVHLKGLANLSALWLDRTRVTDAGLVHLKGLTNLSVLELRETEVTDAGLVHLKGLTKLEYLGLADTQVTDAGVHHLKRSLPSLRIIR